MFTKRIQLLSSHTTSTSELRGLATHLVRKWNAPVLVMERYPAPLVIADLHDPHQAIGRETMTARNPLSELTRRSSLATTVAADEKADRLSPVCYVEERLGSAAMAWEHILPGQHELHLRLCSLRWGRSHRAQCRRPNL